MLTLEIFTSSGLFQSQPRVGNLSGLASSPTIMFVCRHLVKPTSHAIQLLYVAKHRNYSQLKLNPCKTFSVQARRIIDKNSSQCKFYASRLASTETPKPLMNPSSLKSNCTNDDHSRNLDGDFAQLGVSDEQHVIDKGIPNYSHKCDGRYLSAINDLNSLQSNKKTIALHKYNNPQDILPLFNRHLAIAGVNLVELESRSLIHISGTKGKGSTCSFIESILRRSGYKTGSYNSPHLLKINERIKINGVPLADDLFAKYFYEIYHELKEGTKRDNISMPTYFAFLTILGFHVFIKERVDCAIIEVGIGGQYDPTNVIRKPVVCGITTLDYDHTEILGKTIEDIAWSKAGICKPDVPLFTILHDQSGALRVIESRAKDLGCPITVCKPLSSDHLTSIGIKGSAQLSNAALACQISKYFIDSQRDKQSVRKLSLDKNEVSTDLSKLDPVFQDGLSNSRLSGRCQIVKFPRVSFFLDGAHTRKSMENCLEWYRVASSSDLSAVKVLLINIIGDRDRKAILMPLAQYGAFETVIFSTNRIKKPSCQSELNMDVFLNTQVSNKNSDKSCETLENNFKTWKCLHSELGTNPAKCLVIPHTEDSLRRISEMSANNIDKIYHVLVTGSLHFVGATLQTLNLVISDSFN